MKKFALKLIVAAVILSITTIRGQAEAALDKMRTAWEAVKTYQVTIVNHQEKGGRTEDRTIRFSYAKPGRIRSEIIEGKNKGGVAVYDPKTNRVRVRQAGVVLSFSPDAALVCSLRGERIYEGSFGGILEHADWYLAHGSVEWIGEETFEGAECAVIEFKTDSPGSNHGIARERWWLDKKTGFPRRGWGFDAEGRRVQWVIFRNLVLNPTLSGDCFEL